MDFHRNWHRRKNPQSKFIGGNHRITPSPTLRTKTTILGEKILKIHANINNNPMTVLNVRKLPKFPRPIRNQGRGTRCRLILDWKWQYGCFAHAQ